MTINQILIKEFNFISQWTDNLVADVCQDEWLKTPDHIHTNLHWILGHIMHNKYWHALGCIKTPTSELVKTLKIGEFDKYFQKDSDPTLQEAEKQSVAIIQACLWELDREIIDNLQHFREDEFNEETIVFNPVATTKYESLSFAIKHQMWHNGQIAMIKRILRSP